MFDANIFTTIKKQKWNTRHWHQLSASFYELGSIRNYAILQTNPIRNGTRYREDGRFKRERKYSDR